MNGMHISSFRKQDEVNVTYYFACSANDRHRFQPLIRQLQEKFSVTKDYDQF